jgi:excisionase family DNA binding protein
MSPSIPEIPNLVLLGRSARSAARPAAPPPAARPTGTRATGTRLLTAAELAERWQVPASHVYRLAREGGLPSVKLGRYVRFRLDLIERWERVADRPEAV